MFFEQNICHRPNDVKLLKMKYLFEYQFSFSDSDKFIKHFQYIVRENPLMMMTLKNPKKSQKDYIECDHRSESNF